MLLSLLTTALLMGLAGIPHCATMCAAPCAAALPQGVSPAALAGRTLGYAALGAVAASATGLLATFSAWTGALQPLWVMLLAAAMLLGAWMAFKGVMPELLQRHGTQAYRRVQAVLSDSQLLTRHPWLRQALPMLLGAAWAALPCGLLYGAVLVAALAPTPAGGAAVMAVFSLPGAVALWWLPRRLSLWRQAGRGEVSPQSGGAVAPVLWRSAAGVPSLPAGSAGGASPLPSRLSWLADPRWAMRVSGALLAVAAGWALSHRLMAQWQAWCA